MNIALTDDLQQLLTKQVENGRFPDEEAVVREALRTFLAEDPRGRDRTNAAVQLEAGRTPGPFMKDEMVLPPTTLPRPSSEVARPRPVDATRLPDRFPGE